mmetsp:Transcript_15012/g.30240  ORF Transcript_15012/g.30240 Transcript_15012/m.30240 type:complete len:343 (+) Transcript_15012:80-1108(+)
MPTQRAIEMEELSQYFKMPEKAVAKHLGICLTSLKKICRQNGIHRWPYRKIKSLDKKLKKLENAMVNAKDDPSMAHAVSGYSVSTDYSEFFDTESGSSSPTPSASEASVATTPRHLEWASSGAPSPQTDELPCDLEELDLPAPTEPVTMKSLPVTFSKAEDGQPIKLELSLTPEMLKEMTDGSKNITFVLQGANGETSFSVNSVNTDAQPAAPKAESVEPAASSFKAEDEMSDEDLIAMLADCASAPAPPPAVKPESFAQVIADSASASAASDHGASCKLLCLEPSDAELMAALAGCCGGGNLFDQDFGGHDSQGADGHTFYEDDMLSFGHPGAEDFLGMHA